MPPPQLLPTQRSSWTVSGLLMQSNPQTAGPFPSSRQPKKHATSSAHAGLTRHWLSSPQQLSATHPPHAVPSDGHAGPPQTPLSQLPSQHSRSAAQAPPFGVHGVRQTPSSHAPLQHSAPDAHASPSSAHAPQVSPQSKGTAPTQASSHATLQQSGSNRQISAAQSPQPAASGAPLAQTACEQVTPPQTPCSQTPEQHASAEPQASPSGPHPPQTPALQRWPQQSAPALQAEPSGAHGSRQMPLTHMPLQHGAPMQRAPFGMQAAAHAPSTQLSEQHCSGELHALPSGEHRSPQAPPAQTPAQHCAPPSQGAPSGKQPCPQIPSAHRPVQQSPEAAHGAPSRAQLPPPQIPCAHAALQQSAALWQGSPSSRHTGASGAPPAPASSGSPTSCSREPQPRRGAARTARNTRRRAAARGSTSRRLPWAQFTTGGRDGGAGDDALAPAVRRTCGPEAASDATLASVSLKIDQDHGRFRQIVRGRIRENLRKYISQGELIGRKGKDLVSIPIPQIDIPRFRFGDKQRGGVGQGDGNPGDPVGGSDDKQPGQGQAGSGEGDHLLEVDVTLEELASILGEELELPDIQDKGKSKISNAHDRYSGIRRVGPESLRHFKRTYREALKRMISSGTFRPTAPVVVPIPDDKRYRSWKTITEPVANAVIIYMMDVSGSMGDEQKEIVRIESFWLDAWLTRQYKGLESRFIIHDAIAREVDRDTFFHTRESGGTMISSAYKLCSQIIDNDYPPAEWNIYPFHFSDGDNWSMDDTLSCVDVLKTQILPRVNMFAYGQVESPYGSGQFIKDLKEHFSQDERVVVSEIRDKDAIVGSIKDFLGKGK